MKFYTTRMRRIWLFHGNHLEMKIKEMRNERTRRDTDIIEMKSAGKQAL